MNKSLWLVQFEQFKIEVELLVLMWPSNNGSPKSVFIMGGGEGSAAREALRHKSIEKVVMCDIDQVWTMNIPIHDCLSHVGYFNTRIIVNGLPVLCV